MNELANQVVQIETDDTELDDLTQINSSRTCIRRNKPGCSAQKWSDWPEEDLDDMESTLAVQQVNFLLYFLFKINLFIKLTFKFIQQLIKKNPNETIINFKDFYEKIKPNIVFKSKNEAFLRLGPCKKIENNVRFPLLSGRMQ